MTDIHASTFALDLLHAAPGEADPAVRAHVDGCDRCAAYLAELDSLDAGRPPAPRPPPARRVRRWAPVAVGLALAAAVALVLWRGRDEAQETGYVAAKGVPSAQLLVRREGETFVWDGRAPVRAHDALALRVACEGLAHVAVVARTSRDVAWSRLKDVDCPGGPSATLPFTLLVDEEPTSEELVVVMSKKTLDDRWLAAAAEGVRAADRWAVRFELTKETGRDR